MHSLTTEPPDFQSVVWFARQTARGWGARGGKPYGIQKVTWDGTNPFELHNIKLTKTGFRLTFTDKIDSVSAVLKSLSAQQWHYKYSKTYGSPKIDQKPLAISKATLYEDQKTLDIELPLTAGKVVEIDFSGIKGADKRKPSVSKVYYTLNQLL